MKQVLTLIHLSPLQKRMRAHVWLEGNFVLFLHGTAYQVLHMTSDRFLAFSNSANLTLLKAWEIKNIHNRVSQTVKFLFFLVCLHPPSSIWITQFWFVHFFLCCTLLHRYISSKVDPSFVEVIKMAVGFGDVRQYGEWI